MTEDIAATPGWVDEQLDALFAQLPDTPEVNSARDAYAACLAGHKQAAAPSDTLGAEFKDCRAALHRMLQSAGIHAAVLDAGLEALEADVAGGS
jgi:hypothetical protein